MLVEFLTEEVVVEELLGGLLRVGTGENWLECGGNLALRGSCLVLGARSLKRATLDEGLHVTGAGMVTRVICVLSCLHLLTLSLLVEALGAVDGRGGE